MKLQVDKIEFQNITRKQFFQKRNRNIREYIVKKDSKVEFIENNEMNIKSIESVKQATT